MNNNKMKNHYEGVVTYKNEKFLYFKLEDVFVNAAIYLATNSESVITLPELGKKVIIENAHLHDESIQGNTVLSLCCKSKIKQLSVPAPKGSYFLWMVKYYKMGQRDLFKVTKLFENVKSSVLSEIDLSEFIIRYVENILIRNQGVIDEIGNCGTNKLPKITCKTISQCKSVQLLGNVYNDFPYWSYGNHWSLKNEVLLGYLFVHPDFGTICFRDSSYTVGCVIVNNSEDLSDVLNKTVYVKRYCIFTEIYNPNSKFNLEYLFINYNDIAVLSSKRKMEFTEPKLRFKMKFILLNKSYITFSCDRGSNFWLEIEVIEKGYLERNTKCFLCLAAKFIENWARLEVSYIYSLWFNENLVKISDVEYTRLKPQVLQYFISKRNNAVFGPREEFFPFPDLPFLDGSTIQEVMGSTGLVSFQAVLKFRKFNDALSSRTKSSNVPHYFGTLGLKTHLLDFQVEGIKTLTLYMNNWERIMMPLALLPGVLVNVRNVLIQKKYCKSTALTSFEVIDYKPKSFFQSAKLFSSDDWGIPCYFGEENIPEGALVFSIINAFYVKKFSLQRRCSKCLYISKIPGSKCVKCGDSMEYSCRFVANVSDGTGEVKIICNELDTIRVFMLFTEEELIQWKKGFESIGSYYFTRWEDNVDNSLNEVERNFVELMNELIISNEPIAGNIALMCRKLDNSRDTNKDAMLWYLVRSKIIDHTFEY
ncbi:hypothetical protein HHI36_003564 [Cryptolaemus montrouzieri]|uniref:Uncharacterized protein n=1 Tax=Cryptolaemus montrouzieri TaxID=559131 RepID=A0ABD2PDY0_9CUCU